MGRAAGLLFTLLLSSCASSPSVTWDRLGDDEAVWARCQRVVAEHRCGRVTPTTNIPDRAACVLNFMNELRAQTTFQTQRGWLLANGCPGTLVSPEQFLYDEYDEAYHATHRPPAAPARTAVPAAAATPTPTPVP